MNKSKIQRGHPKTPAGLRRWAVAPKPRPKNYAIALTRTNGRGGRKP